MPKSPKSPGKLVPGLRGTDKTEASRRATKKISKRLVGATPPVSLPFKATLAHMFLHVGGVGYAIEACRILALEDERYKRLVFAFDQLSPSDRETINLESLCDAAEIKHRDFIGDTTATIYERNIDIGKLIAAASHPGIVEATIKAAHGQFGMPDRKMLLEASGFLPQKPGMQLMIDNSRKTLTVGGDTKEINGPGMPAFEERSVSIAQAIRGDESATKLLPPAKESQSIQVPSEECSKVQTEILDAEVVE